MGTNESKSIKLRKRTATVEGPSNINTVFDSRRPIFNTVFDSFIYELTVTVNDVTCAGKASVLYVASVVRGFRVGDILVSFWIVSTTWVVSVENVSPCSSCYSTERLLRVTVEIPSVKPMHSTRLTLLDTPYH